MFWTILGATFGGVLLALLVAPILRAGWQRLAEHGQMKTIEGLRALHLTAVQQAKAGQAVGVVTVGVTRRALDDYRRSLEGSPLAPRVQRAFAEVEATPEELQLLAVCANIGTKYGGGLKTRGEQFIRECVVAIEAAQRAGTL